MSRASEMQTSPGKSASFCSSSDVYVSSDKDEGSRSTVHRDDGPDTIETADRENTRDMVTIPSDDDNDDTDRPEDDYFRPIKKLRMMNVGQERSPSPSKPLTSFLIKDILSQTSSVSRRHSVSSERAIVRPWDLGSPASLTTTTRRPRSADDDTQSEKSESDSSASPAGIVHNSSPLDALFEMTSKAFKGLDADEKSTGMLTCFYLPFSHMLYLKNNGLKSIRIRELRLILTTV